MGLMPPEDHRTFTYTWPPKPIAPIKAPIKLTLGAKPDTPKPKPPGEAMRSEDV